MRCAVKRCYLIYGQMRVQRHSELTFGLSSRRGCLWTNVMRSEGLDFMLADMCVCFVICSHGKKCRTGAKM